MDTINANNEMFSFDGLVAHLNQANKKICAFEVLTENEECLILDSRLLPCSEKELRYCICMMMAWCEIYKKKLGNNNSPEAIKKDAELKGYKQLFIKSFDYFPVEAVDADYIAEINSLWKQDKSCDACKTSRAKQLLEKYKLLTGRSYESHRQKYSQYELSRATWKDHFGFEIAEFLQEQEKITNIFASYLSNSKRTILDESKLPYSKSVIVYAFQCQLSYYYLIDIDLHVTGKTLNERQLNHVGALITCLVAAFQFVKIAPEDQDTVDFINNITTEEEFQQFNPATYLKMLDKYCHS
jgi:hypothetical protein